MHTGALALKHCRWTGVLSSISITANFQWLQPVSGSDMAGALVPFEQVRWPASPLLADGWCVE